MTTTHLLVPIVAGTRESRNGTQLWISSEFEVAFGDALTFQLSSIVVQRGDFIAFDSFILVVFSNLNSSVPRGFVFVC